MGAKQIFGPPQLSAAGRRQLQAEEEGWRRFALAVGKVLQTA